MRHLAIVSLTLLSTWASASGVELVVNVTNAGSETLHEISVNPGNEFEIDLRFAPDTGCGVVAMHFKASTAGVLDVIDGAWISPWLGAVPVGGVDPMSASFGGGVPSGSEGAGPHLATMLIAVDANAAPATYTLNVDGVYGHISMWSTDYIYGDPGPDFLVHVVPEPGALLLALFIPGLVIHCRQG